MTSYIPPKLSNYGNTCYFNSVLQCLLNSRSIREHLSKLSESSELSQLLHKCCQNPQLIYRYLKTLFQNFLIISNFKMNEANDAIECLSYILDRISTPEFSYIIRYVHIKQLQETYKHIGVDKDIQVLVLVINRLTIDMANNYAYIKKIHTKVNLAPSIGHLKLSGLICHTGSATGGHYYAVINTEDGQWWQCDDKYIHPLSHLPTDKVIMAFYDLR